MIGGGLQLGLETVRFRVPPIPFFHSSHEAALLALGGCLEGSEGEVSFGLAVSLGPSESLKCARIQGFGSFNFLPRTTDALVFD
jgi:hypothetical protein